VLLESSVLVNFDVTDATVVLFLLKKPSFASEIAFESPRFSTAFFKEFDHPEPLFGSNCLRICEHMIFSRCGTHIPSHGGFLTQCEIFFGK